MADRPLQLSDSDPIIQFRWGTIFDLLSMDVVAPFYDLMGLRFSDPQVFKELLRTVMLKSRSEHDTDPDRVPYYSASQVLEVIATTLGAEVRKHVLWWGRHIFDFSLEDHRALDAWTNLFRYCGNEPALWSEFSEEVRDEILREFRRSLDMQEYNRRTQAIEGKPLSDWDLHMYALRGFDDDDPALSNGPSTYVEPTIKTYQGYRFHGWLRTRIRAQGMETLYQNALPIAQRPKNQALMSPLPDPRSLDGGL